MVIVLSSSLYILTPSTLQNKSVSVSPFSKVAESGYSSKRSSGTITKVDAAFWLLKIKLCWSFEILKPVKQHQFLWSHCYTTVVYSPFAF